MRENRALNGRLVATKKETHYSANFMEEKSSGKSKVKMFRITVCNYSEHSKALNCLSYKL